MAVRVQIRRGTASEWLASNPILLDGEFAIEKDTRKFKIGDGTTAWNSLAYATQGEKGADGLTTAIKVGTTQYNHSGGIVSIPAYPTKVSELENDSGFLTSVTKTDVDLGNVTNDKQMPISGGVLENYREKLVTLSGTSTTINLSLGNVFTHSLTGNTTYSMTNAVSGQAHSFTLIINQTGTGRTITFPASVQWQGGEKPDLTTASKTYVLTFMTVDGGVNWLGMFRGEFYGTMGEIESPDDDFTWVDTSDMGEDAPPSFYLYTGTKEIVKLPESINNTPLTSTSNMFMNGEMMGSGFSYTPVVKVILTHANVTDMNSMFAFSQATSLDLSSFDTSNVTDMRAMFFNSQATSLDLSNFDTSNVTDMSLMFFNSQATSLDLSSFDTSNVTSMSNMFEGSKATSLDLSSFDTSNVTDMSGVFWESQATTLDLSSFDTSNVTSMRNMFYDSQATTLDLSSFDTSSVTSMVGMFDNSQVTTLDLSSFDTSNVNSMRNMFYDSKATSLDLSSFNTSNVTDMSGMFYDSQATSLDLSSFNTSNVTDTYAMFEGSQATTGYARTQADADKFNASSGKPASLTFVVKP